MFSGDLRKRVEVLEAAVLALAQHQRVIRESLQTVVESANDNALSCNANFASIVESLEQIVDRLAEDAGDADDEWWRRPHD